MVSLPIWTWVVQLGRFVGRIHVDTVASVVMPKVMSLGSCTWPSPGRFTPAPYFAEPTQPALPWSTALPMAGSDPELTEVVPVPSSNL